VLLLIRESLGLWQIVSCIMIANWGFMSTATSTSINFTGSDSRDIRNCGNSCYSFCSAFLRCACYQWNLEFFLLEAMDMELLTSSRFNFRAIQWIDCCGSNLMGLRVTHRTWWWFFFSLLQNCFFNSTSFKGFSVLEFCINTLLKLRLVLLFPGFTSYNPIWLHFLFFFFF